MSRRFRSHDVRAPHLVVAAGGSSTTQYLPSVRAQIAAGQIPPRKPVTSLYQRGVIWA